MIYNIILTCQKYEIEQIATNRNKAIQIYKENIKDSKNNPYKPVWIELQFLTNNDFKTNKNFKTALLTEVKTC